MNVPFYVKVNHFRELSPRAALRGSRPLGGIQTDYAVGDYELPDYGDFPEIVTSLRRLTDAGRPVLCLTGDVHWGRVATAQNVATSRMSFAEVISSPASLVSTVGVDQAKKVINVIGGLFGKKNDWPRHSEQYHQF